MSGGRKEHGEVTGLASTPSRALNTLEVARWRCDVLASCSESEESEELRSISPPAVFVLVATEKWPARSWAKRGGILYDCVNI